MFRDIADSNRQTFELVQANISLAVDSQSIDIQMLHQHLNMKSHRQHRTSIVIRDTVARSWYKVRIVENKHNACITSLTDYLIS